MRIFVTGGPGSSARRSSVTSSSIASMRCSFRQADLCRHANLRRARRGQQPLSLRPGRHRDAEAVHAAIAEFRPYIITHLAAESHVDRSIDGRRRVVQTNVVGTYTMLAEARSHWLGLDDEAKAAFRFHHISTDEVYGSLGDTGLSPKRRPTIRARPFGVEGGQRPSGQRLGHTFGLPVLITNARTITAPITSPRSWCR